MSKDLSQELGSNMKSNKLVKMILIALLGSISLVLFFISFPLPMLPPYLKVDFSDVPALIAGIIFSPLAGVLVVLIKNILYVVVGGASDPIGVTANFIAGVLFILPVSFMFKRMRNIKGIVYGLILGSLIMSVLMSVLNYFVILPAYAMFVGMEMNQTIKWTTVLAGVLPFNLLKGVIVSLLFIPLFIKMHDWLMEQKSKFA